MKRRLGQRAFGWAKSSAQNVLEIARLGRIESAENAPFEIVDRIEHCRLRRYLNSAPSAPLVLVPPLMLTAEIYDVAPDLSAVRMLTEAGVDAWVVDFGAPEREEGGMTRTLDDHVRAVSWAIERVAQITGANVHLAGYSQGGMFAYQAAALRRSQGVASLISFGSPVDIHRNVPQLSSDLAGRAIRILEPLVEMPLRRMSGLPGALSSTGFRMLTPKKEVEQLVDFVRKLHDRQELARRASRRRFLAGEGFVAWPGPALLRFFNDFIVHNRMLSGGFVIDGRMVSLADIRCPILYFLGTRDDFARPASVRAIVRAAPEADCFEVPLSAGHFGLVVGSTAKRDTWPTVIEWLSWRENKGPEPRMLQAPEVQAGSDEPEEQIEVELDYELLTGEMLGVVGNAWRRLGDAASNVGDTAQSLRWQLPRILRLQRMKGNTRVSPSLTLARQARAIPDGTFFLWKDRAFSYRDADTRVGHVTRGLVHCGIHPGDVVAVVMAPRPSYLSLVTALNRLGAVALLVDPSLEQFALVAEKLRAVACDPDHAERCRRAFQGDVLVLGGGPKRSLPDGVIDMEAIDPETVKIPEGLHLDDGRARDLAFIFARPRGDDIRLARVSNGRWAFSALGVASAATLTTRDTVYCCLPPHHPAGMMVGVGGAMMGGSRLAMAARFDSRHFWSEVRRYGASVAFYAGEMARALVTAPIARGERAHPLRLFAGSGMRADVWRRLHERFGVGVLEFYASTERNLVLANASGEKPGALGRPLPGSADIAIARYDFRAGELVEQHGRLLPCRTDEPGIAIARARDDAQGPGIRRDVFEDGDRWFVTGDVLRRDADGDYWFVDRLANMVKTSLGLIATRRIEDVLYELSEILVAVVYGERIDGNEVPVADVVSTQELDAARLGRRICAQLLPHERPRRLRRLHDIPMTEGFQPLKRPKGEALEVLTYDPARESYSR
ncbi:MAG TPA: alpha/beta fold hydrolase [Polyangiaceae bacterium]|nr:alpha/beta fold hydrolase [Polyangiaceae bacterium]